jgi:pyruvate kinase
MHRRRYAKIVATLGPASSSSEMIRALFEAAADVFRFNFSHGTDDEHLARYDIVRAIEAETGRPIEPSWNVRTILTISLRSAGQSKT